MKLRQAFFALEQWFENEAKTKGRFAKIKRRFETLKRHFAYYKKRV